MAIIIGKFLIADVFLMLVLTAVTFLALRRLHWLTADVREACARAVIAFCIFTLCGVLLRRDCLFGLGGEAGAHGVFTRNPVLFNLITI